MLHTQEFFNTLLGLSSPFSVSTVEYQEEEHLGTSIHIHIGVDTSPNFRPYEGSVIHDYQSRTWQHLNLFQYPCYLHCKLPKYKNKATGKVHTLAVPWAEAHSGFTLLFEAFALELVRIYGCVAEVAAQLKVYPQRIWRIVKHHAKEISAKEVDYSKVSKIGIDETSRKKGHDYITCFLDLETGELLYVTEGKSGATVAEFGEKLESQGIDKEKITDISIDMSPAFIAGVEATFSKSEITFDKFHVSQLVQKAFDSIRKYFGRKEGGSIDKWIFFKDRATLTQEECIKLDTLLLKYPVLEQVYTLKNEFNKLWEQTEKLEASAFLSYWTDSMRIFKKKVLTTLANTLDKHHQRIVQVVESKVTNALLEGFNSKIQTLKRKARGYRNVENLILMVKLHCAKQPT